MKAVNLLLIGLLIFSSCSRISEEELWSSAEKNYLEQKLNEAINDYREIVKKYPKSTKADSAQFLIASIYNNELQDFRNAITEYKKFTELFPNDYKTPKALFLIGFIYNNQLHEIDSAKIVYEEFIAKYPDDELAPSAQMEIITLGKDPSELIQPELAIKEETQKAKKSGSAKAKK